MINVLGFELETAKQMIESGGQKTVVIPCDDKPQSGADANIIVRQRLTDENTIELLYGKFKTEVCLKNDL